MEILIEFIIEIIAGIMEIVLEGGLSKVEKGLNKNQSFRYRHLKYIMFTASIVTSIFATVLLIDYKPSRKTAIMTLYIIGGSLMFILIVLRIVAIIKLIRSKIKERKALKTEYDPYGKNIKSGRLLLVTFIIGFILLFACGGLFIFSDSYYQATNSKLLVRIALYVILPLFAIDFLVGVIGYNVLKDKEIRAN